MKQHQHDSHRRSNAPGQGGPAEPQAAFTVVGGLPWAGAASGPGRPDAWPPADDLEMPRIVVPPADRGPAGARRSRLAEFVGAAAPSLNRLTAGWGEWLLRHSPAVSTSLSIHCLLLLLLALVVVRERQAERLRLTLGFAGPKSAVEEQGPAVVVAKVPVEEPQERTQDTAAKQTPAPPPKAPDVVPDPHAAGPAVVAQQAAPAVGMLLTGRDAGRRAALVRSGGGSDATEEAVELALAWLARQTRREDGLWSLTGPYSDGGSQENRLAATAMALLAFQGAGNTRTTGQHHKAVDRAWKSLLAKQQPDGSFAVGAMPLLQGLYSHAQATIALCELYGMTRDETLAEPASRAVAYALAAQGPNGGWKYEPGQHGDMSVTGWYMMALKSGQMAGLGVPAVAFDRISAFVDSVANDKGTRYGYMRYSPLKPASPLTPAVTAEAFLCRQYLGWPRHDPRLVEGLELLMSATAIDFQNEKDVYAWYYITQVAHHMGGEQWQRWNAQLREVLPREQIRTGGKDKQGSWDPGLDKWGHVGGRLFMTCFCTYMLEVYYRHLPLYASPIAGDP